MGERAAGGLCCLGFRLTCRPLFCDRVLQHPIDSLIQQLHAGATTHQPKPHRHTEAAHDTDLAYTQGDGAKVSSGYHERCIHHHDEAAQSQQCGVNFGLQRNERSLLLLIWVGLSTVTYTGASDATASN